MSWTRPAELRRQVERLWERGVLLAELVEDPPVTGSIVTPAPDGAEAGDAASAEKAMPAADTTSSTGSRFPLRLTLKRPNSTELAEKFDEVRAWIAELRRGRYYRVVMREVRHRVLGTNAVPAQVWIDTLDDAFALIGKTGEARRFREVVALTRERVPILLPWLARYPLKALEFADEWPLLLDVVVWIRDHPRPGIYLRQIDLPGVHSKFIEARRGVLAELLDQVLPPDAIDTTATGVAGFARRYGFLEKPQRVRFRILDPRHSFLAWPVRGDDPRRAPSSGRVDELEGGGECDHGEDRDFEITATAFTRLRPGIRRVFVTENEVNFLAFPPLPDAMIIFGAGYGLEKLADVSWLRQCEVYYWGDIDTHGFAILDQLRAHLPHAKSFLMDRDTLMAHEHLWGEEPNPVHRELTRLEPWERALYDDIRAGRLTSRSLRTGVGIRLEQERIAYGWLAEALARL
ncbi:MAG TPA: DUF3322 domain-containing protein [Longimicrobiales bacterium]|nr:DUF3322 domain-containing protein [Longimicrobiales bacterium]